MDQMNMVLFNRRLAGAVQRLDLGHRRGTGWPCEPIWHIATKLKQMDHEAKAQVWGAEDPRWDPDGTQKVS